MEATYGPKPQLVPPRVLVLTLTEEEAKVLYGLTHRSKVIPDAIRRSYEPVPDPDEAEVFLRELFIILDGAGVHL